MAVVYPNNHKKYPGSVKNLATGKFQSQLLLDGRTESRNFETKEEAISYKKQRCIELGLPIKNMLFDFDDYYEMELTRGLRTKIDKNCFDLVDAYIWSAKLNREHNYAAAHEKGTDKIFYLHNMILDFTPNGTQVGDHINRETLNNRRANLRIVEIKINNINQGERKDNVSGIKGIHYCSRKNAWIYQASINGKRVSKSFGIKKYGYEEAKQLAIDARKNIEENDPTYSFALNN